MASCWNGIFMCDAHKSAGTEEKTVDELRALGREHSDYYLPHAKHTKPTGPRRST
jgi:hypothetical protein